MQSLDMDDLLDILDTISNNGNTMEEEECMAILRKHRRWMLVLVQLAAATIPPEQLSIPEEQLDLGGLTDTDCLLMFR